MNSTQTIRLHRKYLRWLIVMVGIMVPLIAVACNLTDQQIARLEDPDFLETLGSDPYIIAYPDVACPGEIITVEWYAADHQPDNCGVNSLDNCIRTWVWSNPRTFGENDVLNGTHSLPADPSWGDHIDFYLNVLQRSVSFDQLQRSDDVLLLNADLAVNPSGRVADVEHTYSLVCDSETNTWVWDREDTSDHPWGNQSASACLGIVGSCSSASNVLMTTPGGVSDFVEPSSSYEQGRCFPSEIDSYHPNDVTAENNDPAYEGVIGSPCTPGDSPPVASGMETFTMNYWLGCMANVQGPSGGQCSIESETESVIFSNASGGEQEEDQKEEEDKGSGTSGDKSCTNTPGDGTCCYEAGEDYLNSPADCVAPAPFCGLPCANDAQCAGLGVNPTCAGGYCYDAQQCDTASSGGSSDGGGSSGGGQNSGGGSNAVCGNGIVESGEACDGFKNGSCDWNKEYCTNSCSCDTLD